MMLLSSEHIYLELPITKQNYLNCHNKCASATHWLHILLQKPWISLVWGFLWIFSRSQLLKRRSVFPRKGRAESNSHSHTSLRKDSLTVAENLKKLLIFEKQMRRSFGKNIKRKKMKSGGPCPRAPGRAPQEPCHGFCFWKTPHIFRNLKTEVVIDYNIMYYYL